MWAAGGRAFARVALAGNPSDGYAGRTLAVVVRDLAARVEVEPAAQDELAPPGPGGERLLACARDRFRRRFGRHEPVTISCSTTVPREVGLAGSSAIVIGTLRALCAAHGVSLDPDELAREALAVEVEELGIAAGLQDRIVQAREGLFAMDFTAGTAVEALDPSLLPPLFVAWHPDAAAPSGAVHSDLRDRHARGDPEVHRALAKLAALAQAARAALVAGDRQAFAACVDGSLDQRLALMPVHPRVLEMADLARQAGGSANSAGSGGAIVGTLPAEPAWPGLRAALERIGCGVLRPRAG
jgi:glucuronokinase